jgi:transcriptional regulator with XRE-family HTH domain
MKKSPVPVDKYVGSRVRMRRILVGMSQEKLGEAIGLTFQQVQKYEKGTNRISASRLSQIAQVLGVPVTFFFEGAPMERGEGELGMAEPPQADFSFDLLSSPEGVQLAKAFMSIDDAKVRRRVVDLVSTLVEGTSKK